MGAAMFATYSQSFVDGLSLSDGHMLNSRHLSDTLKNMGLRVYIAV